MQLGGHDKIWDEVCSWVGMIRDEVQCAVMSWFDNSFQFLFNLVTLTPYKIWIPHSVV